MLLAATGVAAQAAAGASPGGPAFRTDTIGGGTIIVARDTRTDLLIRKQADYNEKVNLTRKYSHGFRIQVLNTTDRSEAITTKTRLLQLFPQEKVYLLYQEPYFKVRLGNFRDREEADAGLQQLNKQFPGSFVIPSAIEPKPEWLKEATDNSPM
ncbi:sporulation related protein [Dinghuibacter silviterrae]|uniref:Sporulation related protein n=2 Tax=Dinghuibacter silviterrae TaxID=1539049 RepID=A0A4R8DPW5_9BACT|nr:sporulation related protein [Dinghuibacter silviterrae]